MHPNSLAIFNKYAMPALRTLNHPKILEVGPDVYPSSYQTLVQQQGGTFSCWHTIDMIQSKACVNFLSKSEYDFDLFSEEYDVVISGQVIEHVRKIWRWMPEIARVCKREGMVITINPVNWEYHRAPVDCWRIYPEGMRALYDDAGLEVFTSEFESTLDDGVIDCITIGKKR